MSGLFDEETVRFATTQFLAAALAMARILTVLFVLPVFTRLELGVLLRGAIALVLALPLAGPLTATMTTDPVLAMTGTRLVVLIAKEMLAGLILGLVLGLPFYAAEVAGDVLDLQRGATLAQVVDPTSGATASITATLLGLVMIAVFFAAGGQQLMMQAIYDSYGLWPAGAMLPAFSAETPARLLGLIDTVVSMGVVLAGPLIIALFVTDVVLAVVSRATPQLNAFDLSLAVKNLVFTLLLTLYAGFLIAYMRDDLARLLDVGDMLSGLAR
ncbi:type III secretion system export apparatus subunit SctT [Chelatococcus sp. GCM10030263]|uniref:type III secretion system export apparatus subunit SctT n=1 Tax=Chelatococcus sp. GCM10030263 TaxID=3273387 RepID=UPI00361D7B39